MKTRSLVRWNILLVAGCIAEFLPVAGQARPRIVERPGNQYLPAGAEVVWRVVAGGRRAIELPVAIAAGSGHSLAVTAERQVLGWGDNQCGRCRSPFSLSNVLAIAAGENFSLARTEDGRLVARGRYADQFTDVLPSGPDFLVQPVAHAEHALARVLPRALRAAPRVFVRLEDDQVLLSRVAGAGRTRSGWRGD